MKLLIDESLPRQLKKALPAHQVETVQELGWSGLKNGELLKKADADFDVLLTADKNMRFQQNLRGKRISIVVFPSNRLEDVMNVVKQLESVLQNIAQGIVIEL